jgi:hypothetical protein
LYGLVFQAAFSLPEYIAAMDTHFRHSGSERWGSRLGRLWRVYRRADSRVAHWLAAHRIPLRLVKVLLWVVKAGLVLVAMYIAFWFALVVLALLLVARGAHRMDDHDEDEPREEWRHGYDGVGLYARNGERIYSSYKQ